MTTGFVRPSFVLALAAVMAGGAAAEDLIDVAPRLGERVKVADTTVYCWVFGRDSDAVSARRRLDALVAQKIAIVDRVCQLSDAQERKLQLAGHADVERVFGRVEEINSQFQLVKNEPARVQALVNDAEGLKPLLKSGQFRQEAMLTRVLEKTLTAEQLARYKPLQVLIRAGGLIQMQGDGIGEDLEINLMGTAFTDDDMARLAELPGLEELRIGNTQVTDAGLVHLRKFTGLRRLSIGSAPVTDAGLENLRGLTALRELKLGHSRVTDAGLRHLQGLTALQMLGLHGTQVTDAGLVHLHELRALETLWLIDTRVTDAGLVHLRGLTKLYELRLGNTRVADAGLAHLSGHPKLGSLWLNNTLVTDAGLAHLKGLPALDLIVLFDTRVTAAGAADLRLTFPKLRIGGRFER